MVRKSRVDLAELDPQTSDLHLIVGPAEELEFAVRRPADVVSAAEHTRARFAEGVRDERGGGQTRT
ncbi:MULTISPECIES: hypothetical protein [Rhodococcus]|uniref:hypothetical protein n=1 Tax=Rhodococcus TaxID=1827 RepID=UPI001EEF84A2|nr:hypothetical protein [Rhodococcus sp. T7]